MKFSKLIIIFLFALGFLFVGSNSAEALDPYRSRCVGIDGKFTVKNWKGGPIQVGCSGDDGGAVPADKRSTQACIGEVQTVKAGQTFRLTKCSCFGSNKGCLIVGKDLEKQPLRNGKRLVVIKQKIQNLASFKNNNCTINKTNICGSNGKHYPKNIRITCVAGPTDAPTPTPTGPTATPTICVEPGKVTNVKVTCPDCVATPTPDPDNGGNN